jgi:hypothetical protein
VISLITGLRIAILVLGALLLSYAALVYEDEERQMQNRIESLWVRLHDRSMVARRGKPTGVGRFALLVTYVLDLIFGIRLLSVQAAIASLSVSMGTAMTLVSLIEMRRPGLSRNQGAQELVCVWLFFGLAFYLRPVSKWLGALFALAGVYLVGIFLFGSLSLRYTGLTGSPFSKEASAIVGGLLLVFSIFVDIGVIAVVRRLLRIASHPDSAKRAFGWLLALFLAAFSLSCLPFWIATGARAVRISMPLLWISFLNVGDVVFLLMTFSALGLLFAHHFLFWPAVLRPLYAIQRYRLFSDRRISAGIGIALITVSFKYRETQFKPLWDFVTKVMGR